MKIKNGVIGLTQMRRHRPDEASCESLTTRIGRLRWRRCGSTPALTIFDVFAPTSNYEGEELEAFNMYLERLYRKDHAFFKVIVRDFNAKIGPRRTAEELYMGDGM
ncbi:unnamed protein product [Haemonchus placei]|uniref:Uncharacterized protein n=1 Tax=Haemonchus placei TaxID=6290 RepID=A0A0N4WU22_HAEPC|nr:unnamed protein product [Haemonchus placei]